MTVIKAGRLFDGTGEVMREAGFDRHRGRTDRPDGAFEQGGCARGRRCHRPLRFNGAARFNRLPHASAISRRPLRRYLFVQNHAIPARFAAVLNARKTLEAGFTTVRDLGSSPFLAVDLRNSINEGFLIGPRVVASGPGISMTGGHGDLNNYSPQTRVTMFPEERDYKIADGVDQVRHAVRAHMKYGADVIKIHASGGVLSHGDKPGRPSSALRSCRQPLTKHIAAVAR